MGSGKSPNPSALQVLVKSAMLDFSQNTPGPAGYNAGMLRRCIRPHHFKINMTITQQIRTNEGKEKLVEDRWGTVSPMNRPPIGGSGFLCTCESCAALNAATLCALLCQMLLDINQSWNPSTMRIVNANAPVD